MVYTPMMYAPGMSDEAREARKNRSILKTEGTGWDVGAAVRFLAGDEARWMSKWDPLHCSKDFVLTRYASSGGDITRRCWSYG